MTLISLVTSQGIGQGAGVGGSVAGRKYSLLQLHIWFVNGRKKLALHSVVEQGRRTSDLSDVRLTDSILLG